MLQFLFSFLTTDDRSSFLFCAIVLFVFSAGLILLKSRVASRDKDRDVARSAKLDQMIRENAIRAAKRAACAIEEMTQTALSKEDAIELFRSAIGIPTSSTSGSHPSSTPPEEPSGPSVTLNIEG